VDVPIRTYKEGTTMDDAKRIAKVNVWRETLRDVNRQAREIAERHGGASPKREHEADYNAWEKLSSQSRMLRDLLTVNTYPHEWHLRD